MKINEIEIETRMDRANIRYYEREGLIHPKRQNNGYRDYSQEDLNTLLKIKLLRSLNISLEDIKSIINGHTELHNILTQQLEVLTEQNKALIQSTQVCKEMLNNKDTYQNLDAHKYLESLSLNSTYDKHDKLPYISNPIQRYLARYLDLLIYRALFLALLNVFKASITITEVQNIMKLSIISVIIMIIIEPFLLHFTATTPGKAIFGYRIKDSNDQNLSYGDALARTLSVAFYGLAFLIPLMSTYRLYKSYLTCAANEVLPWDETISYSRKDEKITRYVYLSIAYLMTLLTIFLISSDFTVAPSQGKLTLEKFASHHNYYQKQTKLNDTPMLLGEDGKWQEHTPVHPNFLASHFEYPNYEYEIVDEEIMSVSFKIEHINDTEHPFLSSYDDFIAIVAKSLATPQKTNIFTPGKFNKLEEIIYNQSFTSYNYQDENLSMSVKVEYKGYFPTSLDWLVSEDDADDYLFRTEVEIRRHKSAVTK